SDREAPPLRAQRCEPKRAGDLGPLLRRHGRSAAPPWPQPATAVRPPHANICTPQKDAERSRGRRGMATMAWSPVLSQAPALDTESADTSPSTAGVFGKACARPPQIRRAPRRNADAVKIAS